MPSIWLHVCVCVCFTALSRWWDTTAVTPCTMQPLCLGCGFWRESQLVIQPCPNEYQKTVSLSRLLTCWFCEGMPVFCLRHFPLEISWPVFFLLLLKLRLACFSRAPSVWFVLVTFREFFSLAHVLAGERVLCLSRNA